jgi:hypothetical protein
MDRWAKNTIRTLGIVLASILLIIGSLVLALLSVCAYGGAFGTPNKNTGTLYLVGLVLFVCAGALVIAKLAKGIIRDSAPAPAAGSTAAVTSVDPSSEQSRSDDSLPHLSPGSKTAIHGLIYAIAAQIGLGALSWFWTLRLRVSSLKASPYLWAPLLSVLAYNLPYVAIIYSLLRKPGRRTFAYALTVPGILILYGLFSSFAAVFYLARINRPLSSLALLFAWALHILIFYLAWKAIRQIGIHPDHGSLLVAGLVTFLYFSLLPFLSTALYVFAPRLLHG